MASSEINEFLCGPLVTWFISCLEDPNALTNYDDLIDGVLLHNVFLQIDPEPLHDGVTPSAGDSRIRVKNLEIVVDNIRQFYEEQLGHLLLTVPDTLKLGRDPERHVPEVKLLLLLLLGCAVQCSNKEDFITRIKTLNVDTQLAIVDCIKQVTDYQDIVVTQESMENVNMGNVFTRVKKLMQERNTYRKKLKSFQIANSSNNGDGIGDCSGNDSTGDDRGEENGLLGLMQEVTGTKMGDVSTPKKGGMTALSMSSKLERLFSPCNTSGGDNNTSREEVHRYAVELADWKSKVRKQRQELEEKTESLIECKEELEHNKTVLVKLREENQELLLEARAAKSYRDDLDAAIERAERADRLEAEVGRYREKLTDIEYYKSRIEELREDNRVLMETREMLEEQLTSSRKRSEKVLELESEMIKYEQLVNEMALERVAERDKYQEVCEENAQLQRLIKSVASEVASGALEGLGDRGSGSESEAEGEKRLSEQLTNNAQARALKLELENRRLSNLIDSLKEESFHENSSRLLELEKEKKQLSLKVDSLTEGSDRLSQQNRDLEQLCKETMERLQESLAAQRAAQEKRQQEQEALQGRLTEAEARASKERQRLQGAAEAAERRAETAEREASDRRAELAERAERLEREEREREAGQREVQRLRGLLEARDVALDEASNAIDILEQQAAQFQAEIGHSAAQISRLREVERSSRELDSRAAIDREALESLQTSLLAEKRHAQQASAALEKLGLAMPAEELVALPTERLLECLAELPEVARRVTARAGGPGQGEPEPQGRLRELEAQAELLHGEKARLEVQVARLESQSASLGSQQAALQLTNSRLEARVEELVAEQAALERTHGDLGRDQQRLQALHEQLSAEYEGLSREKETLKVGLRDARNEARLLREANERLEARCLELQAEREALLANAKSLGNLRGEHSKLKEDFRNLYTNTESLKGQYRALQEDYRSSKLEGNRLSLRQTEMQGELSARDELLASLELEIGKLSQRCEMLLQMNTGLDNDRRSLMEHISLLFSQYHELLNHSLEDKEHYHMEEKMYTDKVNHLYRQKEKLEEKIMEHYRKLDSCSTKKKSLGASLVRRVRKAGSGLFGRSGRRASWGAANSSLLPGDATDAPEDGRDDDDEDDATPDTTPETEQLTLAASEAEQLETGPEADSDRERDEESEGREVGGEELPGDPLSLGNPGTRRTVYYAEDSSPSLAREPPETRPLLIYNKVSAVINESTVPVGRHLDDSKLLDKEQLLEPNNEKDRKTANSVWYEYGCV